MSQLDHFDRSYAQANARGFSLVEVLVSLVVISVGMLGIAKMHALAYASTATASMRSLAAIEASSLASSIHVNRAYWATTPVTVTVTTTTVTSNEGTLTTALGQTPNCKTAGSPCTAAQMAAFDLQSWANSFSSALPNAAAQITCPPPPPTVITCNIQLSWNEKVVAIKNAATTSVQSSTSYQQFVEP
jgi:type IV pilus assembly protein PilV